jgi:dipeptidyl aminopeptidase/acylaminoacyl peptidase
MDQFNALKRAFLQAGLPIETFVVSGEGHGFYKPANRADLYRRMDEFLRKHIGPTVSSSIGTEKASTPEVQAR